MTDDDAPPAGDKRVRKLEKKLARTERNMARLQDLQATNSRLLQSVMEELEAERAKSEALLLNILPKKVGARLSIGERLIADRFDEVTILSSDFVGFTAISARAPAPRLVEALNSVFSEFDALTRELGVEKVKTIGDAYMVASGLPEARADHVRAAAEMALAMREVLGRVSASLEAPWHIRIGVHTGPVVANIIGAHKFAYDVWGDTVNLASRLEATSEPDRIQVSADVAEALGRDYRLTPRGLTEVRGKGAVETYFLEGRKQGET